MAVDLTGKDLGTLIEEMINIAIEHDRKIERFKTSGREFIGTAGYESSLKALTKGYHDAIKPYVDAINIYGDDPGHS